MNLSSSDSDIEKKSPMALVGGFFWELVKISLLATAIIVPVRYFLLQPFFVRGASMEPNFQNGEYLVVDELSYFMREPRRGEVIVFRYPNNPSQFFIKRIVGLPGETVRVEEGRVIVQSDIYGQGAVLDESQYLPERLRTGGRLSMTLGEDEYFVLGDNRAASSDSRSWGLLAEDAIVGRAWIRAFPFDRIDILPSVKPGFIGI